MSGGALVASPATDPHLGLDVPPVVGSGAPHVADWLEPSGDADGYDGMLTALRDLLDTVAAARLDEATIARTTRELTDLRDSLRPRAVAEVDQVFARRPDLPGRGQTLVPVYAVDRADPDNVWATITFGRYHLGSNGAVHGGSLALLFENLLGQLAISGGRTFARAAYTHVDFRSVTPVGRELTLHAWFVSEVGRKRVVRAVLRDGDVVCAEAEGLCIELLPGQP